MNYEDMKMKKTGEVEAIGGDVFGIEKWRNKMGEEGKIIFNKEMAEKLHNIDLMVARLIYKEIEKLDLDGREK